MQNSGSGQPPGDDGPEEKITCCQKFKYILGNTWKFWFCILAPLLLLPIFIWQPVAINPTQDFSRVPHSVYLLLLMAAYWISECIPLPVTAFIPIVLAPVFSIANTDDICGAYMNGTIMFLFGGCIVALAFEYSNLHTRISFLVMKTLGARPPTLLFGMMMTCMVLSCWMNNTSTTAMMVPVIFQIVEQYRSNMVPNESPEELARMYGGKRPSLIGKDAQDKSVNAKSGPVEPVETESTGETEGPSNENTEAANEPEETKDDLPPRAGDDFQKNVKFWEEEIQANTAYVQNLQTMFLIGTAVASNIGGTGVITGTGTNLIAQDQLSKYRNEKRLNGNPADFKNYINCIALPISDDYWDIDFAKWIQYNILTMLINNLLAWAIIAVYYLGFPHSMKKWFRTKVQRKEPDVSGDQRAATVSAMASDIQAAIKMKYKELGKTSFHQYMVLILFLFLVCLWIFSRPAFAKPPPTVFQERYGRTALEISLTDPKCVKLNPPPALIGGPFVFSKTMSEWGWSKFFGDECNEKYIHDYIPTMLICVLLMLIPKELKHYKSLPAFEEGLKDPLLPFDFIAKNSPWGPLFMLGGGFAISTALKEGQLGILLGQIMKQSTVLKSMDQTIILAGALVFTAALTSIASNTATAVIVTPILIELSRVQSLPPMYLVLPPVVSASYAFCLPISTPPNAIVYDKGNMKQKDMFGSGLILTIVCNLVLYAMTLTATYYMMGVNNYAGDCD